jgi:hypothetical protein
VYRTAADRLRGGIGDRLRLMLACRISDTRDAILPGFAGLNLGLVVLRLSRLPGARGRREPSGTRLSPYKREDHR